MRGNEVTGLMVLRASRPISAAVKYLVHDDVEQNVHTL